MGIAKLREELLALKLTGAERLTMQYEDGGKIEVFSIDQRKVRVVPAASAIDISEAFKQL